jgi:NAD-dependent SIR2 family protein deacetylase
LVKQADCVLVIGTSLQVYPAAHLAFESAPGVPLHVIDPAADVLDVPNATAWPCAASAGLARLNARWFA